MNRICFDFTRTILLIWSS